MNKLTTLDAARILDVTPRQIRSMISSEKINAEKIGRDWIIMSPLPIKSPTAFTWKLLLAITLAEKKISPQMFAYIELQIFANMLEQMGICSYDNAKIIAHQSFDELLLSIYDVIEFGGKENADFMKEKMSILKEKWQSTNIK